MTFRINSPGHADFRPQAGHLCASYCNFFYPPDRRQFSDFQFADDR